MNDRFDELAKGLAQSATRRQALKKFGVGLAGMALACFGLANFAKAGTGQHCRHLHQKCGGRNNAFGFCCPGLSCIPINGGYWFYTPVGTCM
jgi:hypothetical protein